MCSISCGTVFRRIEEVVEDTRDTSTQNSSSSEFGDMPEMPVHGPTRPHRKRRQEDDALTNLRKFRRIQLVDASIVLGSVHKRKGNRLKVYELVNNDWFDRGTGFGACIHVNVSRYQSILFTLIRFLISHPLCFDCIAFHNHLSYS